MISSSLDYSSCIYFLPQLSAFVPLKNEFYSFRAQTDQHLTLLTLIATTLTVVPREVADLNPFAGRLGGVSVSSSEPGIGQFREFEPRRVHTRINSWGQIFFLCTNGLTCGKRERVS